MSEYPPRTYSVRHETRRDVLRAMMDDEEAWVVCIDPATKSNGDGTTSTTIGFPVLVLTGWVAEPEHIATLIAAALQEKQI